MSSPNNNNNNPNPRRRAAATISSSPGATTLASPLLRKTTILALFPALPLCITHGALAHDIVPALGLIPLSLSAGVSLFLLLRTRARCCRRRGKGRGRRSRHGYLDSDLDPDPEEVGEGAAAAADLGRDRGGGEEEEVASRSGLEPDDDDDGDDEHDCERAGESVLTHRILVFVVDVILAAGLMVVLVFTWIRTRWAGDRRPELAMLAAYSTMPLLINFLIHLYLAARELVAGLAIPGLVEYTAWRAVPPDCPHCGSRLRPDSLPPIPWYETVSRPKVSLPQIKAPSIPRPSLPAFKAPKFSGLKGPGEWKVPNWLRGRNQEDASLFVDDEQNERDRYRDDPDAPSGTTSVVATGSGGPALVEEVVVAKKDKRGNSGSSSAPPVDGEIGVW
ncbi:hypothetical protein C8A00DRAFT_43990 [Chaetomidium leptoderma]|uniref:Uncharacterized protein n=1 Tax=Chaetomidium leptoderma TaxID=669021 RepID=A0AAN6ZWU0_9PEZI|nr:hypothetical protein C8A00DRAFT_43990 [Chaetomidium leptoderma]